MDERTFEELVRARIGPVEELELGRVIDATLGVLAAGCSRRAADRIARALPPRFRAIFATSSRGPHLRDADDLYIRAARRSRIPLPRAVEEVQAIAAAIGHDLDEEALVLLARELPPRVADLFRTEERPPSARRHAPPPAPGTTLARARGLRQEQEASSLASARPQTATPLATARATSAHPISSCPPPESAHPLSTARPR